MSVALVPTVETALSPAEKTRLAELEKVVDEGNASFLAIGHALIEIRQDKLWRDSGSFETYVKERFGYARRTAFQLQGAAVCADIVRNCALATEGTLRPLTKLIDLRVSDPTANVARRFVRVRA